MNALIFSIFNGALYGLLLFMLSSGLTLIFSMMGVLNLAHSSLFMLGAYFAYTISKYAGFWPALIFAPLIVGVIGAMIERFGLRRVHKFGHVAELLFTFGLFFVFEELVQMVWGKVPVPYEIPDSLDFALFTWLGLEYSAYRVFMVLCSLGIMVALYWLIARTPRVFMMTFGFGSALAAIAGVLGGNVLGTEPAMAAQLGPIIFVVIVLGGLGSLGGAVVASLAIGILTNMAISYDISFKPFFVVLGVSPESVGVGQDLIAMTSGSIAPILPYLMLVLMLIFRPRGLFGTRDV
jgi:branched-chain amino acid transport system permease protein